MSGRAGTMKTTQTAKIVYSGVTQEKKLNFRLDKNKTQRTQRSFKTTIFRSRPVLFPAFQFIHRKVRP